MTESVTTPRKSELALRMTSAVTKQRQVDAYMNALSMARWGRPVKRMVHPGFRQCPFRGDKDWCWCKGTGT